MFLTGSITSQSVASFRSDLEEWAARRSGKPGHVRIVVDSPGGEVFAASGLIDGLLSLRAEGHKVTIVVNGMAASAAGWILQAADERIIGPNSWIMIHGVSTGATGKIGDIEADLKLTKRLEAKGLHFLAQRAKMPMEEIKKHIDSGEDWWLDAREALAAGFVDAIGSIPIASPDGSKK
jgi:ATP-dependent protease ClpP protease subunit